MFPLLQVAHGSGQVSVPALSTFLLSGDARDQARTNAVQTQAGVGWEWVGWGQPPPHVASQKGAQRGPRLLEGGAPAGRAAEQAQPPSPFPLPPLELWAASPDTHFLAELFLGLSLTSIANQAPSDKALKSSAWISPSGAGPGPAGHGLSAGQRLGCTWPGGGSGEGAGIWAVEIEGPAWGEQDGSRCGNQEGPRPPLAVEPRCYSAQVLTPESRGEHFWATAVES